VPRVVAAGGVRNRKPKLGQHFLTDQGAAARIVDALGDISQQTVLEIGPGRGDITSLLAPRARRVIAIELDRVLAACRRSQMTGHVDVEAAGKAGRLQLRAGSIARAEIGGWSGPGVLATLRSLRDGRFEVVQRLPDGVVRCVATSPADTLEPGMTVMSAGRQVQTPVSQELFDRSVRLLTGPPAPSGAPAELLETGIKVIDVMCPLVRGGTVAIAGELRAGTTVVMEELVRRLSGGSAGVSLFTLAPWTPVSIADSTVSTTIASSGS